MQFIEAKKKLKRLAKGKFHVISYELTEFSGKPIIQHTQCRIYIHGENGFYGDTFKEAFKAREDAENIPQDISDGESSR